MIKTKIEYLSYTWNPLAMRCTPCSPGCTNCWHIRYADRLSGNAGIASNKRAAYAGGPPVLDMKELGAPLRKRKPAMIGVQFMGDLFHEDVSDEWIEEVFAIMEVCQRHTFMLLTKRPERAVKFVTHPTGKHLVRDNVWMGTTVENQPAADKRILELLKLRKYFPVLFVSAEPMLGPMNIRRYLPFYDLPSCMSGDGPVYRKGLDWVICGGETGPGARMMSELWAVKLRDQCVAAGAPFFFKKWGDAWHLPKRWQRLLDGRLWEEMP